MIFCVYFLLLPFSSQFLGNLDLAVETFNWKLSIRNFDVCLCWLIFFFPHLAVCLFIWCLSNFLIFSLPPPSLSPSGSLSFSQSKALSFWLPLLLSVCFSVSLFLSLPLFLSFTVSHSLTFSFSIDEYCRQLSTLTVFIIWWTVQLLHTISLHEVGTSYNLLFCFAVCKSCLVRHLHRSLLCPTCHILIHPTDPFVNIKWVCRTVYVTLKRKSVHMHWDSVGASSGCSRYLFLVYSLIYEYTVSTWKSEG